MTTSTTTPRLNYTADGSTAAFTFNFEIADSSSIAVYVGSTLKTLTSEYTVSFDSGTSGTGTVTFTSAPSSGTVTLIRDTNLARTTDFENSGAFLASTVNTEFDRLSQAVIDATDKIEKRAILLAEPNTETATLTLPDAATRADKQLSFDSSGDIQVTSVGSGTVTNIATGTGLTGGPITATGTIAIDSTVATLTGSQTLTNKTLTTPVISSISNTGTVTLPTATDTLVGRATTDTLTNKTINSASNTITITESNISDLGSYITASSSDTLTNKTFDVEGTGNSISNIDVADFKAAAIVTEAEGIGSNDNDTTLPTSAAVKDYVDTQITAEDLDITTDSGTIAIDLDSETLTVAGGTGLASSATGNTVTLAIDSTVATLTGSQTLTNKTLTSPVLNTGVSGTAILDEDDMSSNSATQLATQQSIKAYVDAEVGAVSTSSISTGNTSATVTDTGSDGQFTVVADGNTELTITDTASTFSGTVETTSTSAGAIKTPTIQMDGNGATVTVRTADTSLGLIPNGTGDVYATSDIIANGNLIATGRVQNDSITIGGLFNNQDAFIQGRRSNENITIDPAGTGTVELNANTNVTGTLSTTGTISPGGNITMGGNTITGLSTAAPSADGDVATKKYVDDSFGAIGTSSITSGSTNATVNSTTFSVTASGNLEMTVTDAGMQLGGSGARVNSILDEDAFGSNSATALATQQSIKAYVDNELAGIGTGATLSGSTNNTIATVTGANALAGEANLTFDGSTLAVTGAATVSTTLAVTGASTLDGVTITDNTISTNASNANLEINANGSGTVVLENLSIAGDGATVTGILDEDAMGTNSAVKLATQQSIKAYVDAQDANIASDTLTFTNKTFDANGTGNSISNIETADIAAATLVTAAEGIGSNNNDTTLPTSAAVKAYADSVTGTITALNNQAANRLTTIGATTTELDGEANLTFDGSTLAVTGGITATTSIANDAISIDDNKITTTRSNDNLKIEANGTGRVNIGSPLEETSTYTSFFGSTSRIKGSALVYENLSLDPDTLTDREYGHAIFQGTRITKSSTNSNFRPRAVAVGSSVDLDGFNYTNTSNFRGPLGAMIIGTVGNTSATNSTINTVKGVDNSASINDFSGSAGDITITNAIGNFCANFIERDGSGDATITNAYNYYATGDSYNDGTGTHSVTNQYGFYFEGIQNITPTNNYAFYSAVDTAKSRVGSLERYREEINALTSSSTITVDCSLAPVHTVALGTNTEFNISNLGTGQSVTIIIKSSGTYTATFGTDGSTAVKFPGGAPTITDSGTDVVTIFNDGTDFLGNIAQAYA